MAFFIPEEKLAEIRNTADIVDVVSSRVLLKKAGKDYTGLCPFHSEKTPSFTVSPSKQIFHCFGCGTGGNVFNFLMMYDNLTFPEAAENLARQYGISIPARKMSGAEKQRMSEREQLLQINRKAAEFFRKMLLQRPEGEVARNYLKNRKINRELADRFSLGFAPAGWDGLLRFFNRNRVAVAMAEKAGLVVPRQSGSGHYDRFRNRIIFPIADASGQIVAFGGRVLDDAKPKYLNSPETPVYNKRRILYGLDASREACRAHEAVFVVEGYFDLITMHQFGIANTVATLGTSLTREHVRRLKGYAKKAFLVFDSDAAGVRAAQRTTGIFMDEGMDAAVVLLPEGHDPDSFLFSRGKESFQQVAASAKGLVDFQIDAAVGRNGLSLEGKVRIVSEVAETLAQIADSAARSICIRHLSEKIGADETTILEKIAETREKSGTATGRPAAKTPGRDAWTPDRFEARVLAMMLQYPEIHDEIKARAVLECFEDHRLKAIGEQILSEYPQGVKTPAEFMNRLDDEDQRRIVAKLCIDEAPWGEQSCRMLLSQFFKAKQGQSRNGLLERIRAAEKKGDPDLVMKLLKEKQNQIAGRH